MTTTTTTTRFSVFSSSVRSHATHAIGELKNQKGFQLIVLPQYVQCTYIHKYNVHKYINVYNQQVILRNTAAKIKV